MTARPRASSELSVQFLRRNGAIGEYLVGLLDRLGKLLRCLVYLFHFRPTEARLRNRSTSIKPDFDMGLGLPRLHGLLAFKPQHLLSV
jgi:hypothetical protein